LKNKSHTELENRVDLLKMALSMNITNNRKEERIDHLFSLFNIKDEKDKKLLNYNPSPTSKGSDPDGSRCTGLNDQFIAGTIDGDGSFFVSFNKNGNIKVGFKLTTDKFSKPLLTSIKSFLSNIGSISEGSKDELVYSVTGFNQILNVLIPFVESNPLFSERASHFDKFKKVTYILKNNPDLSLENKLEIIDLAYDMNKKGKRRKMSKSEYLQNLEIMESF
jgi:hypothetical protein